jgi:hypothetical protein
LTHSRLSGPRRHNVFDCHVSVLDEAYQPAHDSVSEDGVDVYVAGINVYVPGINVYVASINVLVPGVDVYVASINVLVPGVDVYVAGDVRVAGPSTYM